MKNIDFSCLEFGNFTTVWEFYILLSCEERPVDVTQTSLNSSIKPCQGNIWWWQLAKGREDIAMHWHGLKRCLRFRVLKCWGGLYWRTGRCLRYFYFVIVEVDYIDWVGVGDARSWPTDISSYPSILEYSRLPYILNILKQLHRAKPPSWKHLKAPKTTYSTYVQTFLNTCTSFEDIISAASGTCFNILVRP